MSRWFKFLPALLVILWLPLSAVASVAMPYCQHQEQQSHAAAMSHGGHDMHHGDHDSGDTGDQPLTVACDACGFCHLACAGVMPASAVDRDLPPAVDRFAVPPVPTFSSRTAEPLPRPPRTA